MNCVLANRRKWFQAAPEPDVPDVPSVWANFNLANAKYVGSAQLSDTTAAANSGVITCYGLRPMADGQLLIAAYTQGEVYAWGFADGHSFEVANFNPLYTSRVNANAYDLQFNTDGTKLFYVNNSSDVYVRELASAYNLGTAGAQSTKGSSAANGLAVSIENFAFSSDGGKLFYKRGWGANNDWSRCLYVFENGIAWSANGGSYSLDRFFLSQFNTKFAGDSATGTSVNWRNFCFSPDGLAVVFVAGSWAVKLVLTEAWNVNTMVFHSSVKLTDNMGTTPTAIAVNADGTKMIVFERVEKKFHEYTLA